MMNFAVNTIAAWFFETLVLLHVITRWHKKEDRNLISCSCFDGQIFGLCLTSCV